jgi:hypothetical protein
VVGGAVYGGALALLFGREWLALLRRRRGGAAPLMPPDAGAPPA